MEGTMGEIRVFGGNFAPLGWAFCNGALLPINQNDALFSLLGVVYGGDGQTTFGLPDFRGRAAVGTDLAGKYVLGQMGGTETATMNTLNMPAHTHASSAIIQVPANSAAGTAGDPTAAVVASVSGLYSAETADTFLSTINETGVLSVAGGGQPFSIEQPYLGLNYIICVEGIYPSRP